MTRSHAPQSRLDRLQEHLRNENTDLVNAVDSYRDLDSIAHRIGLMPKGESYANNISWWPLVAILGTFSAGKSSFINSYLGLPIQETGNQAVDDHFTIIAYGHEKKSRPCRAKRSMAIRVFPSIVSARTSRALRRGRVPASTNICR